jgi:hypothetical protein
MLERENVRDLSDDAPDAEPQSNKRRDVQGNSSSPSVLRVADTSKAMK